MMRIISCRGGLFALLSCFLFSTALVAANKTNISTTTDTAGTAKQSATSGTKSQTATSTQTDAEKNMNMGQTFLEENKKQAGVVTLPSGLQYKIIKEGQGNSPGPTDFVTVNYRGTLINGTEFDSSYARHEPATFAVNAVIPGWTEALQLMKPGAKWTVYVPSKLGYGERSVGNKIGPNSTLIFDIELLAVQPPLDEKNPNSNEWEDND